MLLLALPLMAQEDKQNEEFDWNPVIDAIIEIESRGNERARNGIYVGVLQISPILVRECNNILKSRGDSRRFTLNDRLSREKSKEMFVIIQEKHNPEHNIEKAIKCWNCGGFYLKNNGWKNKSIGYYKKVMKHY